MVPDLDDTENSTNTHEISPQSKLSTSEVEKKDHDETGDDSTSNTKEDPVQIKVKSLTEKGIKCHNMKWQDFLSEVWASQNKPLDAIITNPPPSPSLSFILNQNKKNTDTSFSSNEELTSTDIMEISKSGKRLLKPGGYFIVLIQFEMFEHWYLAFKANGYNVMKRPLSFAYKQDEIPRGSSGEESFPHGMQEDCIIARLPGAHPDGFNPNFYSNFNLIECSWLRCASIVTNVDLPKNKLCYPKSRKPVRTSEKPINLLAEIIDLFVPNYGTTLDLFGGTLTLPIAALKTSRRCIAIEADRQCFELAVDRLYNLCNPTFKYIINPKALQFPKKLGTISIDQSHRNDAVKEKDLHSTDSGKASINIKGPSLLTSSIQETSMDHDDMPSAKDDTDNEAKKTSAYDSATESEPPSKLQKIRIDIEASKTLLLLKNEQE